MSRDPRAAGPLVTGFADGGYKVGEVSFPAGLWLTPEAATAWDTPLIDSAALAPLLALEPTPEFLLLGTGAALRRPARTFVAALEAQGIGVEAMDSRAAARAWGVLRGEERWIVAALLPLGD